jgi:hypothetical protein
MAEIRGVAERLPTEPGGRITSFLPSAQIADRWSAHYQCGMALGFTVTCIADPRTIVKGMSSPAGAIGTIPATGTSSSSAARSARQPPSELPQTTSASSWEKRRSAARTKASCWASTGSSGRSLEAVPKPGRSSATARRPRGRSRSSSGCQVSALSE